MARLFRIAAADPVLIARRVVYGTQGKPVEKAAPWNSGPKKISLSSRLLTPVPITRDNLDVVVKAGWIKKDELCKGVQAASAPAACK